jgi:hypothetical protein
MTIEFGPKLKQELARLLGGKLVEYESTIALVRGRDRLRMEFYGDLHDDRVLKIRMLCQLDSAKDHGERTDSRPRLDSVPVLTIRRKTDDDRKAKGVGLTREIHTVDPGFDERNYVESDAPDEHLRAVLGSKETRQISTTLLEHRCEDVKISMSAAGGAPYLVVNCLAYVKKGAWLPQLAEEIEWWLDRALALKRSLPVFVGFKKAVQKVRLVSWTYRFEGLLLLFGFLSLVLVLIFALEPIDEVIMAKLLGIGLVVAVAFVPLNYLFARGHSRGKKHLIGLSILGIFAFPIGLMGLGIGSNCALDMSEPKSYVVDVIDPNEYCSKDRKQVGVRDWRNPHEIFYIYVWHPNLCARAKPGFYFVVEIKDGLWGWPWLKDYRPYR